MQATRVAATYYTISSGPCRLMRYVLSYSAHVKHVKFCGSMQHRCLLNILNRRRCIPLIRVGATIVEQRKDHKKSQPHMSRRLVIECEGLPTVY